VQPIFSVSSLKTYARYKNLEDKFGAKLWILSRCESNSVFPEGSLVSAFLEDKLVPLDICLLFEDPCEDSWLTGGKEADEEFVCEFDEPWLSDSGTLFIRLNTGLKICFSTKYFNFLYILPLSSHFPRLLYLQLINSDC
jgi:hypothetical protein